MSKLCPYYFALALFFSTAIVHATPTYTLTLPVVDLPDNKDFDYTKPSMRQSLYFTKGFYQAAHYSIENYWENNFTASYLSVIAFDVLATWLPLSSTWLHEEWHRAVMGKHGIDSYNEVYEMEFFSETISVSNVSDDELIAFKKNHPHDFIRMHTAGLESQNQLNLAIEKDQFFHGSTTLDQFTLLSNTVNTTAYLYTCTSDESNELTEKIIRREGTDVSDRDFTGLDCNAWVYDLFRPDEAYTDRGIHPSGVGINRYITYAKLRDEEKRFLRKQYYLSYLNFIDPFLINKRWFVIKHDSLTTPLLFNANTKHYLTPFGYSVDTHFYIRYDNRKLFITLHGYSNKNHFFPGASIAVFSMPQTFNKLRTRNNLELSVWNQPKNLSFTTSTPESGGRISLRSEQIWYKRMRTFVELNYKTEGWVVGELYLEENSSFLVGINLQFGRNRDQR